MNNLVSPQSVKDVAQTAFEKTQEILGSYSFDKNEIYYTFADKSIVPTFLVEAISRKDVNTQVSIPNIHGHTSTFFPAFGASMSFMRARFARDVHGSFANEVGGIHILPRVAATDKERLADIDASAPSIVGTALGINDDESFLKELLQREHLHFLSIDIAHGANAAALPVLFRLRNLGVSKGIILGNVGSVEGFLFAYWLMKLAGFEDFIIKAGVGPGSVCTTRINTGVGVGQLTLLEQIKQMREELDLSGVHVISDGGVNTAGDFVKALALSDAVMMGKFFASGSFEEEVLIKEDDKLVGVQLYGMASAMVTEKRNYIEGSSQVLKSFHQDAGEAISRLREGLQSAMTYVNATDLASFKENVRFATNSHATIIESGVH